MSKVGIKEYKKLFFKTQICKFCGKKFEIWKSKNQVYCSKECKEERKKHKCLYCNRIFIAYVAKKRKFCSSKCATKYQIKNRSIEEEQKRVSKILSKVSCGPNIFESHVNNHLKTLKIGKFKYVGNGQIVINGRSPDFICEENKIVVLANGTYWHLGKYGLKITEENKKFREQIEAQKFLDGGYTVLFVWEDQINNMLFTRVYCPEVFSNHGFSRGVITDLSKYSVVNLR